MNTQETSKFTDALVNSMALCIPVIEMRTNRGTKFKATNYYQIRVKPDDNKIPLSDLLSRIELFLIDQEPQGIGSVAVNTRSVNSSKFSSVSFSVKGKNFDIVVARGANKGEAFEKELLKKMQTLLLDSNQPIDDQAISAFAALAGVDTELSLNNIESIMPRTGRTNRSGNITPSEAGAIIADIIVQVKNGTKKYISVKNSSGSTVANFGIAKAFSEDFSINTASPEYLGWIEPFKLDVDKIQKGLLAARDKSNVDFSDTEIVNEVVAVDSPVYKLIEKMWGADYIYLREQNNGFKALNITKQYLDDFMLKDLTVTEIRYPYKARKQISIFLSSATSRFKIEIRNTSGGLRPSQINLSNMSSTNVL